MDAPRYSVQRISAYLFLPIGFVVLLPFLLLFVIGFYGFVLVQSVRTILLQVLRRQDENDLATQKPHFLEMQRRATSRPDESISKG